MTEKALSHGLQSNMEIIHLCIHYFEVTCHILDGNVFVKISSSIFLCKANKQFKC